MSYEVIEYFVESKDDAFGEQILAIEITDGEYVGTIFSYGEVDFPDPEKPILSFEYTIHKSELDTTTEKFKNRLGDILVEMIEDSLNDHTTVFKGGI